MVLVTMGGWALQRFAGVQNAGMIGLLVGLVVARFVPAASSCSIRTRPD